MFQLTGSKRDFKGEHLASWRFVSGDTPFRALHFIKYPKVANS